MPALIGVAQRKLLLPPSPRARINWDHPLAAGLKALYAFNGHLTEYVHGSDQPTIVSGVGGWDRQGFRMGPTTTEAAIQFSSLSGTQSGIDWAWAFTNTQPWTVAVKASIASGAYRNLVRMDSGAGGRHLYALRTNPSRGLDLLFGSTATTFFNQSSAGSILPSGDDETMHLVVNTRIPAGATTLWLDNTRVLNATDNSAGTWTATSSPPRTYTVPGQSETFRGVMQSVWVWHRPLDADSIALLNEQPWCMLTERDPRYYMTFAVIANTVTGTAQGAFTFAGAGVGSSNPGVADGLTLWLEADSGLTGSPVSAWASKHGALSLTQATSGSRPSIAAAAFPTGADGLAFDGTDDFMVGPAMSTLITASAYTVFAVVIARSFGTDNGNSNAYENDAVWADDGGYAGLLLRFDGPVTADTEAVAYNWDGGSDVASAVIDEDVAFIATTRHASGNVGIALDSGSETTTASGDTSALTGLLRVGRNYSTSYADIVVGAIVVYNRSLDSTDTATVVDYLTAKYIGGAAEITGTASGAFTFTATAAGTRTVTGTAAKTLTFTGTAFGVRTVSGTAAKALDFTGTAAGTRTVTGAAAASFTFSGTASGAPTKTGVAQGAYTYTGSASGTVTVLGQAAKTFTFTGTASGTRTVSGSAAKAISFTGTAAGTRTVPGSATGSFAFTGEATSTPTVTGTAQGTYAFTATSTGAVTHPGTAQGQFTYTGSATGLRTVNGTASSTFTFTGSASATPTITGTAQGVYTLTASASGTRTTAGQASATFGFTATATGTRTTPGTAVGTYALTATASGTRRVSGSAAGTFTFTGQAAGAPLVDGTATGAFTFTATAAGVRTVTGTANRAYTLTATAVGTRTVAGAAQAAYTLTAQASGTRTVVATGQAVYVYTGTATGEAYGPPSGTGYLQEWWDPRTVTLDDPQGVTWNDPTTGSFHDPSTADWKDPVTT